MTVRPELLSMTRDEAVRLSAGRRRPGESIRASFDRTVSAADEDVAVLLPAHLIAPALSDPAVRAFLATLLEPWQDASDDLAVARLLL